MTPAEVFTPLTRPPATSMPVTSSPRRISTPRACAARANPIVTPLGSAIPSAAQKVAAATPVDVEPRTDRARLIRRQPVDGDAVGALQLDVGAKRVDARRRRQQEQIAVGPEVDRKADPLLELREERDRLLRQFDVRRMRELMTKPASIATGRSRAQLRLPLEQARRQSRRAPPGDRPRSPPCTRHQR